MHQDLMQLSSYHDKKVEVIWGEKEVQKLQFQQSQRNEPKRCEATGRKSFSLPTVTKDTVTVFLLNTVMLKNILYNSHSGESTLLMRRDFWESVHAFYI